LRRKRSFFTSDDCDLRIIFSIAITDEAEESTDAIQDVLVTELLEFLELDYGRFRLEVECRGEHAHFSFDIFAGDEGELTSVAMFSNFLAAVGDERSRLFQTTWLAKIEIDSLRK
jgi:hypothetical protein